MSDDDDFDELPLISRVNSSSSDSPSFIMPCAAEVAEARARAAHCEKQLLLLRAEHEATGSSPVLAPHHSDSSGSEGEVTLAAAVVALQVKGTTIAASNHAALLTRAFDAAGDSIPPWVQQYLQAIKGGSDARQIAHYTLKALMAAARAPYKWSREDALGAALWLLTVAATPDAPHRAHLVRLTHRIIDDLLDDDQMETLVGLLEAAVCSWTGARVDVCDVLCGGGQACRSITCQLAAVPDGGTRGSAAERYAVLQLMGRALVNNPASKSRDVARRMETLAPRHPHPTPDELKVSVAASKIRVLFDIGR